MADIGGHSASEQAEFGGLVGRLFLELKHQT